ncbi:Low-density lipoprotein receptor-related protein 2 [Takifugu flavidus]|uniref:Low-density lipoprotein receptor-related protein 2 n=1 Tax=Takifugu flavidus TaxID=433684 RepID=A0A5C6PPB9_9TELE|nr:Low-density lipoprotein receptor-related protein 2 [Takifugu flavidus]
MERTIVGTTLMSAAALHARALRANIAVIICAAFLTAGSVTMTTTARTTRMKGTVSCGLVTLVTSSVPVATASLSASNVTATPTVWTTQMRHSVHHVFPMAPTAPPSCLSATTTSVFSLTGNVTVTTTVETILMRSFTSAWTSSVRLRSVSAVTTTVASTAMSCATLLMTVETVLMRDRRTQYACDDYDDCGDQSDELGCHRGSTHTCSDNICEHNCTDLTEGGLICSCLPGYKPRDTERHVCEDVNECEVYGTCPQECKNTKGSYECFCAEGFVSYGEPHGTECAAQGNPPVLLLPDNVRIRRFNLSSQQYSDYVDNAEHIQALDYLWDPEGQGLSVVYWTVLGRGSEFGSIKRAHMTTFNDYGNNPVKEVDLNLRYVSRPDGIALDWVGRHIYWTDSGTNRIEVAKLDGRMMYWTDWGRKPRIEMAWMDGQHREVLVDEDLGWPTGLTVDYLNGNRIYWCDLKENSIESMKPDGTDRKVVISGDIGHPYSLDVFEGHVYWSSKDKGEVWRTNKFGNGNKVKVLTINPWLTQVRIYQEHRHNQTVPNPCKNICSHLCLLRPGGYTCACPQGSSMLEFDSGECDAAIEPPIVMPLACRCMNGGTCYTDEGGLPKCKCPYGYIGSYCEAGKTIGAPARTAVAVLLAVIIIIITGALAAGVFLNYKRTGSFIPSMPKLPSLSSLVKSADTGNGVTFHSGDNVDLGPSRIGVSFIDTAMQLDDNFAMEGGRQPITFENPLYANASAASGDPAVIHATQVTVNPSGEHLENNFVNPTYAGDQRITIINTSGSSKPLQQESKWSLFMKKLKPSTAFPNPSYAEMKDEKPAGSGGDSSGPEPSPFVPTTKLQKRDRPGTFSPTEDSFKDTATLVKEDSDV